MNKSCCGLEESGELHVARFIRARSPYQPMVCSRTLDVCPDQLISRVRVASRAKRHGRGTCVPESAQFWGRDRRLDGESNVTVTVPLPRYTASDACSLSLPKKGSPKLPSSGDGAMVVVVQGWISCLFKTRVSGKVKIGYPWISRKILPIYNGKTRST